MPVVSRVAHDLTAAQYVFRSSYFGGRTETTRLSSKGQLVLPGLSAPPRVGSLLMLAAGVAWGVVILDEPLTLRLVICSIAILGGIALVIANKRWAART